VTPALRRPMPGDMALSGAWVSRRVLAVDTVRGVLDMRDLRIRDDLLVEFLEPVDRQNPCDPAGQRVSEANEPSVMDLSSWHDLTRNGVTEAPARCWGPERHRLFWVWWSDRRTLEHAPRLVELEFVTDGEVWAAVDGTAAFCSLAELERNGWRESAREAVEFHMPWARARVEEAAGWLVALENLAPGPRPRKARARKQRVGGASGPPRGRSARRGPIAWGPEREAAPAPEACPMSAPLTFSHLAEQNLRRCEEAFHGIDRWSPTDWGCALAGETGELCNLLKKLRRGDQVDMEDVADELADVICYADLTATRLGIDLAEAVRRKFNRVSEKRGSAVRL